MRRITLLIAAMYTVAALAQWGKSATEPLWINANDEYFYAYDLQTTPNGNTWFWYNGEGDVHYVQLYDSTGVALLGDELMLVSDHPDRITGYINQTLFVDREGNAIVVVSDLRHAPANTEYGTYTAYKISQTGEMLWGEEGVSLDGGVGTHINACMDIAQLSDGSYVFTWTHCDDEEVLFSIDVQRLSPDGQLLWNAEETRLTDPEGKTTYFWPYIVDAGMGQCILVFTKGSGQELCARKLDFDGTPVWSEDARIYRGGFLSTPLWTLIDVEPSGDGGVIVTWYDDRNYTNIETIYMSYVKPNGELGFSSGLDAEKLTYSGYRALSTACTYDPASDSFIALWREATQGQSQYRVVAQSISKEGELLWGEEGKIIEEFCGDVSYNDLLLRTAHDGEMALFFMRRNGLEYGNVDVCMQIINTTTGDMRWDACQVLTDSVALTQKNEIQVSNMLPNGSWIFGWDDRGTESIPDYKRLYINRANYDATVGNKADAAVEGVEISQKTLFALVSLTDKNAIFAVEVDADTQATLAIHNINGTCVAEPFEGRLQAGLHRIECNIDMPAGIYFATLTTSQEMKTIKLIIK